jgi:hypothetical protein
MHPRRSIGGLTLALLLSPLHAQTDNAAPTTPVTRAIAVYEWTGPSDDPTDHPTATRLIPISLFVHNHLEDAGTYLPQPIPFALRPGNVYTIERAGQPLTALDLSTANNPHGAWAGYGHLLTLAEETATITPPPSTPILPAEAKATITTVTTPTKNKKQPPQKAYVTAPTTTILDDPDRPTLQSGPPSTPTTTPKLTTLPADLHQAAAVSDAANHPPETFTYTWPSPTTHDQTLQALEALSLPALTHYISFNHLTPTPSTTNPSFANTPTLTNPQLRAYTLSPSAKPTYILTAESPLTTNGPIYITLIAEPAATGQPHIILLSLTDAEHLNRTPWLRPIDAADPDATGQADLLFELRSQTTRQFALYTLTTGTAQQTLLTTPIE